MRIAILSDASGPTDANYPGHGLGRTVARMAAGLKARGHDVTLFACEGSRFDGQLVVACPQGNYDNEKQIAKAAYQTHKAQAFDVLIDNTHTHMLSGIFPGLNILNYYHDIWQPVSRCPVLCSEGQRALMLAEKPEAWVTGAEVVHHAVDCQDGEFSAEGIKPEYALFMGILRGYKQPLLAIEACAKLGLKLIMVGPVPPGGEAMIGPPVTNVIMTGPMAGEYKRRMMREASVFLQLGTHESFGLTTIEAGLSGVPVVAEARGGSVDLIEYGVNGVFVPASRDKGQAVADSITRALHIPRVLCRQKAEQFTCVDKWMEQIEMLCQRVARGERWG